MIPYKLAKQLKKAGFPQPHKEIVWAYRPPEGDNEDWELMLGEMVDGIDVFCPDLSELIDSCNIGGAGFKSLEQHITVHDTRTGFIPEIWWEAKGFEGKGLWAKTPKIAVAKLWLKLNEPNPKHTKKQ